MSTTVNGWPVIFDQVTDGPQPRLRNWVVPDTGRTLWARDGACGFLLIHMALAFHEKVERLAPEAEWDDWGWSVRPVRGQTTGYSNHAGGVAVDLNATQHLRGTSPSASYTSGQIRAIRLQLKVYLGLVLWGGDFHEIPDGMHFELAPSRLGPVNRLAKVLMLTPRGQRILKANPGAAKVILS